MIQTHQRLWIILPCFIAVLAVTITCGEFVLVALSVTNNIKKK